ncbi:hypothetical protein SESBI_22681 [Sesbania bispinosa]|nr:hypothetical protein SESBI_22681 [Sesbania bispinosa]
MDDVTMNGMKLVVENDDVEHELDGVNRLTMSGMKVVVEEDDVEDGLDGSGL